MTKIDQQSIEFRVERDSMGERQIPSHAYYGIQTLRAIDNFPISGIKPLAYLCLCLRATIKKATALVNGELGCIPQDVAKAIVQGDGGNTCRKSTRSICGRYLPSRGGYFPPHECK